MKSEGLTRRDRGAMKPGYRWGSFGVMVSMCPLEDSHRGDFILIPNQAKVTGGACWMS